MDKIANSLHEIYSLEGKVAVVIGGGGHLCSAMAEGLAIAGASLLIVDLRMKKAIEITNKIKNQHKCNVIPLEANVVDKKSLQNALDIAIKNYSKVDILINGAGTNTSKPFLEISLNEWQEVMDSQITGTMLSCQVFGQARLQRRGPPPQGAHVCHGGLDAAAVGHGALRAAAVV